MDPNKVMPCMQYSVAQYKNHHRMIPTTLNNHDTLGHRNFLESPLILQMRISVGHIHFQPL